MGLVVDGSVILVSVSGIGLLVGCYGVLAGVCTWLGFSWKVLTRPCRVPGAYCSWLEVTLRLIEISC